MKLEITAIGNGTIGYADASKVPATLGTVAVGSNGAYVPVSAKAAAAEKRAEAKAKGYEGEACGECGNFTLLRNGTCMKCDTCGSTTGCS